MNSIRQILDKAEVHFQNGQPEKAEQLLLNELGRSTTNPEIYFALGRVYESKRDYVQAKSYLKIAIDLDNENTDYYMHLADCQNNSGEYASACRNLEKVIELEPDNYHAINSLGLILLGQGKFADAEKQFLRVLKYGDNKSVAHVNLSSIYNLTPGTLDKAIYHLEKALKTSPNKTTIYNNLANCYQKARYYKKAMKLYRHALSEDPENMLALSNYLLGLHYDFSYSNEFIFKEHKRLGGMLSKNQETAKDHTNLMIGNRRLRVGYVSGDLRTHSVGYFMAPIIAQHNQLNIETFIYYNYKTVDEITMRFLNTVITGWRDITTLNDEEAFSLIREDRIDILVDLSGHTFHSRLSAFAKKPAPVQVTYLGYPDTTGVPAIDYRITDENVDPPGQTEKYHVEKLIRISDSFLCYMPLVGELPKKQIEKKNNKSICFASFNNLAKVNKDVIRLWSRILKEIAGSKLLFKSRGLEDPLVKDRLKSQFSEYGITAERVELRESTPTIAEHLSLYNQVDIGLDPFPYNGTTTTFEALYMGCPVITLKGDRHSARVGYSILKNIGMNELVAQNEEEYLDIAIRLAGDEEKLREIKENLRKRLEYSVLMDHEGFTIKLEKIYRDIWVRYCEGKNVHFPAKITLKNDISVNVPDSLKLMTPFVLREQEDWFESELEFVRNYVQPGMRIIDIGANYGLYTLNMANIIGEEGRLVAFEPSSDTSAYLKMSVKENNLGKRVKVYEAGVSRKRGSAMLSLNANSELNAICRDGEKTDNLEHIILVSLDDILEKHDFEKIDFIKLDAEGEESEIVVGAEKTLKEYSPLIMYELTHGQGHNLDLVIQLQGLGYYSYRLIPSLGILAPFELDKNIDSYQLNLFACKIELAKKLEMAGLLCLSCVSALTGAIHEKERVAYWSDKRFYSRLFTFWKEDQDRKEARSTQYNNALDLYIRSTDNSLNSSERYGLLRASFEKLKEIVEENATIPRLFSLIRIAADLGEREYAVNVLELLYTQFIESPQVAISEQHLALSARYDEIDPGESIGQWYLSSVVEQLIKLKRFSSYFDSTGEDLEKLELLKELGFQSPEMERRRQLLLLRDGKIETPEPSAILIKKGDDNLNSGWWKGNETPH